MWAFIAEAFCWFLNNDVRLDDDVDTTILFDEINCAGVHISNVLKALWEPMQSGDQDARSRAIATLCSGGVPDFICVCATDRDHIAELSIEASIRASSILASCRRVGADTVLVEELEYALDHLDTILYLTAPEQIDPARAVDAEERAYLTELRDACRRDVEETRVRMRAQLQAASN
jgi:hypothetical protein